MAHHVSLTREGAEVAARAQSQHRWGWLSVELLIVGIELKTRRWTMHMDTFFFVAWLLVCKSAMVIIPVVH